ncbi:uncharacterized protein TRAVEDRAFT_51252 [Trametes versicolor FP-101664 SS1]|uniref:uncharacterized protein n=1 Tax=Trametes versicolor (strain FP-101664) TaxID=717944 RepID=UPI00046248BC|nr:uncharacterized protein TRAVEDRAFT_51252 [Trametes versicolor FP-101664 SS1]EIW55128.1 hypothetical protein TRAVEDRAFT_51252 [Trametes versicolor FP-101664 SS1]
MLMELPTAASVLKPTSPVTVRDHADVAPRAMTDVSFLHSGPVTGDLRVSLNSMDRAEGDPSTNPGAPASESPVPLPHIHCGSTSRAKTRQKHRFIPYPQRQYRSVRKRAAWRSCDESEGSLGKNLPAESALGVSVFLGSPAFAPHGNLDVPALFTEADKIKPASEHAVGEVRSGSGVSGRAG